MSLKKYAVLIVFSVLLGSTIAFLYVTKFQATKFQNNHPETPTVASEKLDRIHKRTRLPQGKMNAPLFAKIEILPGSEPEKGFYKLRGTIEIYDTAIRSITYQWVLPEKSIPIQGSREIVSIDLQGQDSLDVFLDLQLTDIYNNAHILFDVNILHGPSKIPIGTSDSMVFRSLTF